MNDVTLLKIYLSETDKYKSKSLYAAIATEAKKIGVKGLIMYRGIFGFGESGKIRNVKILDLSCNLPLIIEIVDNKEKIDQVLNYLTEIKQNVRITIQDVKTERI